MQFRVHTALHEESTNGWIWCKVDDLQSRTLVKILNRKNGKSVICEYREVDSFFLRQFNSKRLYGSPELSLVDKAIVISSWYRTALGIAGFGHDEDLNITPAKPHWLKAIQAGCQHPDIVVRLATRLGVLSLWLGFTSVVISVLSIGSVRIPWLVGVLLASVVSTGVFAFVLSRGTRPPKRL